ncbi:MULTISPECIES: hypothetical protein [Enterobacteriaceae]|uniref:Uncharacterized protein n=1 Tax=Pseudenterobacter timonensis TaxID=1755099 RepID=A0AAE4DL94_9ENTR|nr:MULTISPECIES: hypothetical protein [Enterobacteriaceae]SAC89763.1 Uncharacterised protein [Enterobacter cloacae]HEO9234798.1 hypothetical protein [Enterobacter asburiae]KJC01693.1 hypothetical protein TN43_07875 [Enterobacter hormaechei]KTG88905.1 hypothetical protein ASV38_05130 [Enterobacter hormaechei subsp. xiangfangensis]KVJ49816.1 hypothetical protein AWS32_22805 [Enterobacter hormaechei subsp. xiangfangensis]
MIYRKRYDDYVMKMIKKIRSYYHGMALSFSLHPVKDGSGIIVLKIGVNGPKPSYRKEAATLMEAFEGVEQNIFKGDLSHIKFTGTNIIFDNNKAILVKDNTKEEWSNTAVDADFNRIFRIKDIV